MKGVVSGAASATLPMGAGFRHSDLYWSARRVRLDMGGVDEAPVSRGRARTCSPAPKLVRLEATGKEGR